MISKQLEKLEERYILNPYSRVRKTFIFISIFMLVIAFLQISQELYILYNRLS
jgi:hypothetical protein